METSVQGSKFKVQSQEGESKVQSPKSKVKAGLGEHEKIRCWQDARLAD
jgi:hypothetical protein